MKKIENIKLISCDLDGTLLNINGKLSEETVEVIKKLKEKNITLVANSGRPIYSIPDDLLKLPFDYVVCMNGQYIKNLKTNEVIEKKLLDKDELKFLYKLGLKNNCFSNIHYEKTTYLVTSRKQFIFAYTFNLLNKMRFVFKQRKKTKSIFSMDINKIHLKETAKICFISTYSNLKKLKKCIESLENKPYNCFFVTKNWLEVQHSNISKGNAVIDICKIENINLQNTMAFGDGENDISMLEAVNIGVCMKNGMEETKKVADYIAPSFIENGFAKFIKEYILK